ncbi:MAG TPA: hypothetical protein VK507_08595 [Iamia sp.]|nr:hypothetical protein [Iamia sp.]
MRDRASRRRAMATGVAAVAYVAFPFAKPVEAKIGTVYGAGIYFTRDTTWKVNLTGLTNPSTNSAYPAIDSVYGVTDLNPNTSNGTCTSSVDACVFDNDEGDTGGTAWSTASVGPSRASTRT